MPNIVGPLPNTILNGQPIDAIPAMADLNWIVNSVNAFAAANGINADITALTALVTALTIAQGGTGSTTVQGARSNLDIDEIDIRSMGASDGGDISPVLTNAIAALPNGGTIVVPPTPTYFAMNSMVTFPDGVGYRLKGSGHASKIFKGANIDMFDMGGLVEFERLYLEGNGSSFTGRIAVVNTGALDRVSWRRFTRCEMYNSKGYGVEFVNPISGYGSVFDDCRIIPLDAATPAIKLPGGLTFEANGNRTLGKVFTGSNPIADLASSNVTLFEACQGTAPLMTPLTVKAIISASNRFVYYAGGPTTWTIDGQQGCIVGVDCAHTGFIFNSTLTGTQWRCSNALSATITDNSTGTSGGNSIDIPLQFYTPVWTAASVNPVIGNGQLYGTWTRQAEMCEAVITMIAGTTTTFGTGYFAFSVPVPYTCSADTPGDLYFETNAGGLKVNGGQSYIRTNTNTVIGVIGGSNGQYLGGVNPVAFQSGDKIVMRIRFPIK